MSTAHEALKAAVEQLESVAELLEMHTGTNPEAGYEKAVALCHKALGEICATCRFYEPTRHRIPQCGFWGETEDWLRVDPDSFCSYWEESVQR